MNNEKWTIKKQLIVSFVNNNDVGNFAPIVLGTVEMVDNTQPDDRTPLNLYVQSSRLLTLTRLVEPFVQEKHHHFPLVSFQF